MKLKGYADVADLKEDQRITLIGETAMKSGGEIAFVVDDEPGKADRYIKKLLTKFPQLKVVKRFLGPVKDTETVSVTRHNEPLA
jgi:hypothetical protein